MADFDFEQLVFAGGGIRCFWHGGFMATAGDALALKPKRISSVSGGALSAATWIANRERALLEAMVNAFAQNDANFDSDASNFTPHQEMYRNVVREALPRDAVKAVAEGPKCEVLLGVPPQWLPPHLFVILSGGVYAAEKRFRSTPHLRWPHSIGLEGLRVDMRQAARDGELIDLICAAATIPPVFDVPEWNGLRVLDGGMVDKAPVPEPDIGKTLFLMTSRYRNLPEDDRRTYIQPSEEVAADKIDFSDASKVEDTWAQGKRDGKAWVARHG